MSVIKGYVKADLNDDLFKYAEYPHEEAIINLIKKGANLDATDKYGRTILHYACIQGYIGSVQVLLENGANPNIKDIWGDTPLSLTLHKEKNDKSYKAQAREIKSLLKEYGGIKAMSVIKGYVKGNKPNVKAKAQKFNVDDLGDMEYTDIPKGSIIEGYIWGGSGYTKGTVLFVVKSGGDIEPASSKEWKTMEACWHTDKGVIEAFVDYANGSTGYVAAIVNFLTDTESHSLVAESELGDYGYTPDDDGYITYIGYNKKGENVYLVRN